MHLTKRVRLQLVFFAVVTLIAGGVMATKYLHLPTTLFGIGRYQVTVNLSATGGLYKNANVTYRGVEVGRVEEVRLSPNGVDAILGLRPGIAIPADLDAQVHSQTAIGEEFLELLPRSGNGPALKDGDVVPANRTTLPVDINTVLTSTNQALQAIPLNDLKSAIDESYLAVGGLGPELRRIVQGTTRLAVDAHNNLDALTTLIDQSKPILDTQIHTASAIQAWAANTSAITNELQTHDSAVKGILNKAPAAANEARALLDRLQPTLPTLLANLASLGQVAVTYQPGIEQLLVLLPPAVEQLQGSALANRNTKQPYKGLYLSFNLNLNLPPPCTTGFLPPQQVRPPSEVNYPDAPPGSMYCRVPQDSPLDVRGARNLPCETRPGKRAATVKLCESDENYVPLNDGYNWKGDPNATLSGQPVPEPTSQAPSSAAAAAPTPIATATYDPATGTYLGPDGQQYTQSDLANGAGGRHDWQDLLLPPKGR